MRMNAFRDAYCHTVAEIKVIMNDLNLNSTDVYASDLMSPESPDDQYTQQVMKKHNGDLVCYIEGPTAASIRVILETLRIKEID